MSPSGQGYAGNANRATWKGAQEKEGQSLGFMQSG